MRAHLATLVLVFTAALLFLPQESAAQEVKGQLTPGETTSVSVVLEGPIPHNTPVEQDEKEGSSTPLQGSLGWQTILSEDFEGVFPGPWTIFAAGGYTDAYWDDISYRSHGGSWSAWCADEGSQQGPDGGPYPNGMNTWMIYGPFDLSDANDAKLDFFYWNISETNYDYFQWFASINGTNYYGQQVSGNSGGWVDQTFDLTNVYTLGDLTGEPEVWIAFRFVSDGTIGFEGAYVDDVLLQKNVGQPDITTTPGSFTKTLDEGQSTTDALYIGNVGTNDLNWNLSITENMFLAAASEGPSALPAARYFDGSTADSGQRLTETVDALIAASEDKQPVIVGFRVPFQPEGFLSPGDVQRQRQEIAARREALLGDLVAFDISPVKRFETIPYVALQADQPTLQFLATHPDVVSIEEDVAYPPTLTESIPLIGANVAWAMGYTGAGQAVAILDTGVDGAHAFLSGKVVSEACYSTTNASALTVCPDGTGSQTGPGAGVNCNLAVSGCNHGTHVAGIAAGQGATFSGVAKGADIIAVQVFSRFNSPGDCGTSPAPCALSYTSDQILGLERVYTLRTSFNIAAANMSLGGGMYTAPCDGDSRKTVIDNLRSQDIATVISSGNNGYTNAVGAPGCISTAITVGSTDDGSGGTTADDVSPFSNSVYFLDLLAPGRWINSSVPGGGFSVFQGTSMSAPHVTGAWAVLKQQDPGATVDDVLNALTLTGVPVTDSRNGLIKPRIQLDAALTPPTWLFATPASGIVAPAGSDNVTVTFDATTLSAGLYTGQLTITSDDPDESPLDIPVSLTVNPAGPATRYVHMTGSDGGNNCLSPASPCATIMHAVTQANPGDTLNIAAGTYSEPGLLVTMSLSVQGAGVIVQ